MSKIENLFSKWKKKMENGFVKGSGFFSLAIGGFGGGRRPGFL